MSAYKSKINLNKLPKHVAIIMDGNGRWANQQGKERVFGHQNGVTAVRNVSEAAAELGIEVLTLYAFSTENWNRPKTEVDSLMSLLVNTINEELPTLIKNNISLHTIGETTQLPQDCKLNLEKAIKETSHHTGLKLVLALSYSSRWDILRAVNTIAEECKKQNFSHLHINEDVFSRYLTTSRFPEPELLIRTSGERRISNFLLWEIAYAELYFTETLWPDFDKEDFYFALLDYQGRERRFGLTSEQLT